MVALPSTITPISRPYAVEILETETVAQEVRAFIWEMALVYRERACQRILGYVMERVRQTCTHDYPEPFLRLSAPEQMTLMQEAQTLAVDLRDQLRGVDLSGDVDPWRTLEEAIAPYLATAQDQLDRLYRAVLLGDEGTTPPAKDNHPLTSLCWLEMEMADPELKGLRAQLQVASARLSRLHRQRQDWERKQHVAEAESRWVALQATGHGCDESAIISGSNGM